MLRIAICDDNIGVCNSIEQQILTYHGTKNSQLNIFTEGEKLLGYIKEGNVFDVLFLDIELGTMSGIQIATIIRREFNDYDTKIIFITARDGYEMLLFDVQPFNFLKKPINNEKLQKCLELVVELRERESQLFYYTQGYTHGQIAVGDILYFEKAGKKIRVVLENSYEEFYDSLANVQKRLPSFFVKTHSSFLINFSRISKIGREDITMQNGQVIPVSRRGLKDLREKLLETEK